MMGEEKDLDGFITKEGEMISLKDTDRVSAIILQTEDIKSAVRNLQRIAMKCQEAGYYGPACDYIERILPLISAPCDKAECFLRMGIAMEHLRDFGAAEGAYSRAFDLPQQPNEIWYFLNNNRGYCLNQIGQHQESEMYCRAAIKIQPKRHNAHKNLGIALMSLGRIGEAAKSLIRATKLCPSDSRALAHLDELFACHREVTKEIPDFLIKLLKCHELVQREKMPFPVQ